MLQVEMSEWVPKYFKVLLKIIFLQLHLQSGFVIVLLE